MTGKTPSRYGWEVAIPLLLLAVVIVVGVWAAIPKREGAYILGCTNPATGELHVYQASIEPIVSGSVVYLGDRVFTTPFPGGVCRVTTAEEFERLKKESLAPPI